MQPQAYLAVRGKILSGVIESVTKKFLDLATTARKTKCTLSYSLIFPLLPYRNLKRAGSVLNIAQILQRADLKAVPKSHSNYLHL